jgi:hypothetical protein
MRVTILGVGDVEDILNNTKMTREKLNDLLDELAQFLADKKCEIIIQPTRGIPYQLAVKYKEKGGKRVIGAVAPNCPYYGKFFDTITQDYRPLCDGVIEFASWYDIDGCIGTLGEATIVIGFSTRVLTEICEMKYNLKYLGKNTKLFIFKKTISRTLKEIEPDINAIYVPSVKELKKQFEFL